MGDGAAAIAHELAGVFEEDRGGGAFPLRVGGREKCSNVGSGNGTEQSVGEGMQQDVSVGVAAQALVVRQLETADSKRDAGLESVRVPAEANAGSEFRVRFQSFKVSRFRVLEGSSRKSVLKEVYFLK
jgi:hypothetical protein